MPSKPIIITGTATWSDESDAHPEHPIVIPPPVIDAHPEHPIVIPDPPPPDSSGNVPTHPIYIPTPPIDVPPDQPPVDSGAHPSHPIVLPGTPTHPIYIPDPPQPEDKFRWVFTPLYGWVILPPANVARPK